MTTVRHLLVAALLLLPAAGRADDQVQPVGERGPFRTVLNATFGTSRPGATVRNRRDLEKLAYFRFIYGDATTTGDGTDGLYKNYRSRHRDYPDGDSRSLHVFSADALTLKAHCGLETTRRTDCGDGNIESGMIRFKLPIRPGSYIEMRTRFPTGRYAWPAFWLNPGVQSAPARQGGPPVLSARPWPPEIDIVDQYGFDNTDPGHYLLSATPTNGRDTAFGNPHDLFRAPDWGDKWYYQTSQDLTADYHVYALDWRRDHRLRFLLDGRVYREIYYEWNAPEDVPAHLIASLQIGAKFNNLSAISDQGGKPAGWDWAIDYIRVWQREER
jgi:hypothetical protein